MCYKPLHVIRGQQSLVGKRFCVTLTVVLVSRPGDFVWSSTFTVGAFSAFHRNAPITEAQPRCLLGFWENNPSFPGQSDSRAACGATCVNTSANNRPECGVNSSARHRRSTSRPPGQQRRRPGVAALFPNCRNPGHPFTHFKRLQLPDGGLTNAP